jgi:hypothetical protein
MYERKEFGSFAFACEMGFVSRKSKCAKLSVAVYRRQFVSLSYRAGCEYINTNSFIAFEILSVAYNNV